MDSEPSTPGLRRLRKELVEMKKMPLPAFQNLTIEDKNIFVWYGLICPDSPPYNEGAFKVEIYFPAEFPMRPPKILLKTKIYHPNFDEKGQVCLGMLIPENWKPSTTVEQVLQALIALINDPDPEDSLRSDIGKELATNRPRFMSNAKQYTQKYSEPRP